MQFVEAHHLGAVDAQSGVVEAHRGVTESHSAILEVILKPCKLIWSLQGTFWVMNVPSGTVSP
jgi:hypothetical protein